MTDAAIPGGSSFGPREPEDAVSGEPEVVVLPTGADVSHVAARRIAAALIDAAAVRGVAHWVTTGGSTPGPIYQHLAEAPLLDLVPWDRVHLWWGDDRWVPPEDILSNALACWNLLLRDVPVPLDQVHVMPIGDAIAAGRGPAEVAVEYEATLRAAGLEVDDRGYPRLDVLFVGVGTDGHLLSVFPGSATWDDEHWVQAVPAPVHIAPHVDRVTLHPRLVTAARLPIAVVHGAAKAAVVGQVFAEARDVRMLPAQLTRRPGALWLLDAAAGSRLPGRLAVERPDAISGSGTS